MELMEHSRLLCDSILCRLCGEENKNSTNLFPIRANDQDLSELVNRYLPLQVKKDGKYPAVICPGCNIQLEATKQFLDLIIAGQEKLRELFRLQLDTLKRQEKQKRQLQDALKSVNPKSSVETYTIESDETGEKFLIQNGPLFPPNHEVALKIEGADKPKRKRGRPPKPVQTEEETKVDEEKEKSDDEEQPEIDSDGRRKRKIKAPLRFQGAVQGKELDKMFKEVGVIDEDSGPEEGRQTQSADQRQSEEVIGHLASKEGEDLGELVIVNKSTNRLKIKPKSVSSGLSSTKKRKIKCEICGKEFFHHGRYEIHKSLHKYIRYQCGEKECNHQTEKKTELEEHLKETGHSGITLVENVDDYGQIELKHKPEDSELDLPEPPTTEENEESYKVEQKYFCPDCNKTFSCKQNYEVHVKAIHENQRPYQCDKCEKSFPYLNSLKCHMLKHVKKYDKMYSCETCQKVFNHPSSLVYHREAEHNNGRRFVCNKCNKSFKHKQLLQRHQLVHSNDRPHPCPKCSASFKTRANLLNHLPIHTGEKKYYCTECGQAFTHKTSLTLHTRWHTGQKPYECDVCLKTFSQKGNLSEHKRIHTGEKPYCCDHCGRKFTTSSQFKLHLKRHTGEKPWRCEYCSKTFLHKDTWKCHTRRHRNERPFQCQHCFRGFTEQWALRKHERLHTGEKPYVCDICSKGFADCSNLTKHKRTHNNKPYQKPQNIKFVGTNDGGEILYFAYQDPNSNDSQSTTIVQIMDQLDGNDNPNTLEEEEGLLTSSALPLESQLEYEQIMDNDGTSLSLTTPDGQEIKVVSSIEDGEQNIQGLLSDGSLVPLSIAVQSSIKPFLSDIVSSVTHEDKTEMETSLIEKASIEEPSTSMAHLLDNNIELLNEEQKLRNILNEDVQNICLVTTLSLDETMNSPYLSIT